MNDNAKPTPRWGNQARDRKALAIWSTLAHLCDTDIAKGSWLDVGCGSGGVAAALAPRVERIVGVDPEPWSAWSEAEAAHRNLSFRAAAFDRSDLPISESSTDVAICNQVYEHVDHPRTLLRNIHRALRPGGYCYFAGPNLLWPIEPHVYWPFVHWLPRPLARGTMRMLGSARAEALDAFSESYWTLCRWFREAGFLVANGIPARISAELEIRRITLLAKVIRAMPEALFRPATPFAPGFIFLLRK